VIAQQYIALLSVGIMEYWLFSDKNKMSRELTDISRDKEFMNR
jgi:hypothetical protein